MQHTFIEHIIQQEQQKNGGDWQNSLIIFPNRRPGLFLKKYLGQQLDAPIWSPQIFAIDDFVAECSNLKVADGMGMVMLLHAIYSQHVDDEISIDKFYPLGETLLADFSEIDKQLIDAKSLFANIRAIKELEHDFALSAGEKEGLVELWKLFSNKAPKNLEQEFEKLWQLMGALYYDLRTALLKEHLAYNGMALRNLSKGSFHLVAQFVQAKRVIICGFNAISKAEWKLFDQIKEITTVEYYFDSDDFYLKNQSHEAGDFMRKNKAKQPSSFANKQVYLAQNAKNIICKNISGNTGTLQVLARDIAALSGKQLSEKTAIILPNEAMLNALLQIIPHQDLRLNITMGFPVTATPLFSLLKKLFELQISVKPSSKPRFYHKEVINLLQHPLLNAFNNSQIQKLQQKIIKENFVFINEDFLQNELQNNPLLASLFTAQKTGIECLNYLQDTLIQLSKQWHLDSYKSSLNIAVEKHFYRLITRLKDLITQYQPHAAISSVWKLFKKVSNSARVPFEGEPLHGIQIMGFLESRSLDFENIFLLSMNEGHMPRSANHSSLIPFGIRKAFGMPTFREDDAIYAYHFYRLMQRVKNINFYTNTDVDSESKGEESRYLLQLKHELLPINNQINWQEQNLAFDTSKRSIAELSIAKTPVVIKALSQYELNNLEHNNRSLSPSAIATYVKSPLQFYFRFIERLSERDEVTEEIDAISLGNIVHNTLEDLYQDFVGLFLDEKSVNKIISKQLDAAIQKQLKKELGLEHNELEGRNLLIFKICHRLCVNVLKHDAATENLKIVALEKDNWHHVLPIQTAEGEKLIKLSGKFDRLDDIDGNIRVVDYKTGKIEIPKSGTMVQIIDKLFAQGKYAASLQAMYYCYLYLINNPTKSVQPVIYNLKKGSNLSEEVWPHALQLEDLEYFEHKLIELLEEIWDSELNFSINKKRDEGKYLMLQPIGTN